MTVVDTDRIEMADSSAEYTLDTMFEWPERTPVPEGFKAEIVGGNIIMSPQRQTHWEVILGITEQLRSVYPRNRLASDVRIDFPGHLNGFASDVAAFAQDAVKDSSGRWRHQDVDFVTEVISRGTAVDDFGPKKQAYAVAGVPALLIVDPYSGRCHLFTEPKGDDYPIESRIAFGLGIDLTGTPVGLTLQTDEFPRE